MLKGKRKGKIVRLAEVDVSKGKEILKYYSDEEWKEAIDFTRLYAKRRNIDPPEEWVQNAIGKLISGERSWKPQHPLKQQLIYIVRGDYFHFNEKANKHSSLEDSDLIPEALVDKNTPEQDYSTKQEIELAKSKVADSGYKIDYLVLEAYEKDGVEPHRNSEIATMIGSKTSEVVNSKKRMKRILGKRERS